MEVSRSSMLRQTLRRTRLSVSAVAKRSAWFGQKLLVGIRCTCQRGRFANQSLGQRGLVGGLSQISCTSISRGTRASIS